MSYDPLTLLLWAWIAMAGWMTVWWLVELPRRNASLADVGWCVGLVAVVSGYAWSANGEIERKLQLVVMASVYGLRLGGYILLNRVTGRTEDQRYQRLRRLWRLDEPLRMFGYFQLQAAAVVLFSLPFLEIQKNIIDEYANSSKKLIELSNNMLHLDLKKINLSSPVNKLIRLNLGDPLIIIPSMMSGI